ncbi:cytochrome P450 [Nocardia farcinica]|uniref:cytochrome P450 n=1 Tax=Nocardia farcinica TaxID=37329 RepID=UPI001892D360|nr:cytochrome P450 [Nocardia farcinica]MBF6263633.1 cytochrome P450 [Nocardia farcinica]MBF6282246.1 cytochrome P450 [Nocardia farcinica]MBF6306341.1 cytochrome P450 [Nocardia farcinica]MBF6392852.1 cytochrome P450 [Nocardia farcinica]MBF6489396.1 cytochrome P450 [Nocardia farcinica]
MTTTSTPAPVADWLDPAELAADPYPSYRRLLAESPVAWAPALGRYLVTSFAGCRAVEDDQQTFSAAVSGGGATMRRALGGVPMLRKDDPEHARERGAVNPALRPKNLREQWVPVFERTARRYLDRLRERGPDAADLDRDYAAPVAAQNLVDLLGMKDVAPEDMRRWSHAFIAGTGNLLDDPEIWRRCEAARDEVDTLLDELIPYYRRHPDASITSAMIAAGLSAEQVAANVKLTVAGGMNEPQHMVTNTVWALSRHPDQHARVLAGELGWAAVFDETVRWLAPIGMYPRETTREVELAGVVLPAGAALGVVVGAANRDPAVFTDPDRFDITRPRRPHLGFGSGVHLCAGHWAARIAIGEIAVPLLYAELPGLRTDPRRPPAFHGWVFRGSTALPVTWDH